MTLAHHYRTLGLRRGASFHDIKAAYRQLVRQCHPDINPNEQAVEQFIQINDAYTVLLAAVQPSARSRAEDGIKAGSKASSHTNSQSNDVPASSDQLGPLNFDQFGENFSEHFTVENLKSQLENLGIGRFSRRPSEVVETDASRREATSFAGAVGAPPETAKQTANQTTNQTAKTPVAGAQNLTEADPEYRLKQEAYLQLKDLLKLQKFPRAIALVEGLAHRIPNDVEIIQWQAIVYQRWARQLIGQGKLQKARIYLEKALRTDPHNPSLWNEANRDFQRLEQLKDQPSAL